MTNYQTIPMEHCWVEIRQGVWRYGGEYEIRHIWFSPRETFDLYKNGVAVSSFNTLDEAKSSVSCDGTSAH